MKDERVKPCPFCGGEAEIIKAHLFGGDIYICRCVDCVAQSAFCGTKEEAVAEWNRRVCVSTPQKTDKTDKAKLVFPNGAVIEEDINNTDDVSKLSFNSAAKALSNLSYNDKKIYINMLLDAFFKGENDERESKNKNI